MTLDPVSLLLAQTIISLVLTAAMAYGWRIGDRAPGTGSWVLGFACFFLGRLFITFRNSLPVFVSIFLGNAILQAGGLFLLFGSAAFFGRKLARLPWLAMAAAALISLVLFTWLWPSYSARVVVYSFSSAFCYAGMLGFFLAPPPDKRWAGARISAVIIVLYIGAQLFRGGAALLSSVGSDLSSPNPTTIGFFLLDLVLYLCLVLSFLVLVYSRLRAALLEVSAEKDLLFKEMHHRTKNNLALVQSLVSLAASSIEDEEAQQKLEAVGGRIKTIALLHERLSFSEPGRMVRADEYLGAVARSLLLIEGISLSADIEALELGTETAIPLALLVNELVTNAGKHAFPEGRAGTIGIRFGRDGAALRLEVCDDGIGISEEAEEPGQGQDRLGSVLVRALAEQLGGKLVYNGRAGTRVSLEFPAKEA